MLRAQIAKILLRIISWLPLPVTHTLGRVLGNSFRWFSSELSRVTHINIDLCFPDLDDREKQQLVHESLRQTGMSILEIGALWLWPVQKTVDLVKAVSGWELVQEARSKDKGIIFVAPHLGCWEVVGPYISQRYHFTAMYRPPKLHGLNQMMRQSRERAGATLVPTDANGVRALRKALSSGEVIGILPDQDPGDGAGVFAPFFGIQANTMTLISRLASKSDAAVIAAFAERLSEGCGYHIYFKSAPDCVADKDAEKAATCLNQLMEECVRALPEQYQWGYKRFKTRPAGEQKLYKK
jgi:KDO2-lipid IV(A) lauroyltransferase